MSYDAVTAALALAQAPVALPSLTLPASFAPWVGSGVLAIVGWVGRLALKKLDAHAAEMARQGEANAAFRVDVAEKIAVLDTAVRGASGTNGLVRSVHRMAGTVQAHELELERLHHHLDLPRRGDR